MMTQTQTQTVGAVPPVTALFTSGPTGDAIARCQHACPLTVRHRACNMSVFEGGMPSAGGTTS